MNPLAWRWRSVRKEVGRFSAYLYEERTTFEASWIRIVIFGLFAYKLLSRDFPALGLAPDEYLTLYPWRVHPVINGYMISGLPLIVDLCTFHWIHWLLPHPSVPFLTVLYWLAILGCALVIFFGRGPKRLFVVGTYVLLTYLWGFVWKTGSDIDAVFLPFQVALVYCFSTHRETLVLWKAEALFARSRAAGWVFSMTLLCFCGTYFASGLNKAVDIPPAAWLDWDMAYYVGHYRDLQAAGYFHWVPPVFDLLRDRPILNLGVPLVYASHCLTPIVFFRRELLAGCMAFYLFFHSLSTGVAILFVGYMIAWLALIPVHRFFEPVVVISTGPGGQRLADMIKPFNWFARVRFEEGSDSDFALCVAAEDQAIAHGADGLRRVAWGIPLVWPLLPLLYVPGIRLLGDWFYLRMTSER